MIDKLIMILCLLSLSINGVESSCGNPINEEETKLFASQFPSAHEAFNISPEFGRAILMEKSVYVINKYNDHYKTLRFTAYAHKNGYINHECYINCRLTIYLELLKIESEPKICTTSLIFSHFSEQLKRQINKILYDAEIKISKELAPIARKCLENGVDVMPVLYNFIRDTDIATDTLQRKIIANY